MKWTSSKLLEWSIDHLVKAGVDQPRLDGELLLAEALGCHRHEVHLDPDRAVSRREFADCQNFVERRALREPVHYILGRREFWSLDFKVTPQVLIPRPETEILMERLLKLVHDSPRKNSPRILDIGTGSGNIAVAAAREIPGSHITAVDICADALAVARENAATHRVSPQIHFLHGNLFEKVRQENLGPFDFILSNPPYIDTERMERLMPDVRDYEPRQALDGGIGGLDYSRNIVSGACELLNGGGYLVLEIGDDQAKTISGFIEETGGYEKPVVTLDYSGYPRVVSARKKTDG